MSNKHILIVEDEPGIRKALQLIFASKGFTVGIATDGKAGLEAYLEAADSDTPVDLIITDIQMPRMNGLDMLEKIAQAGHTPQVLVISGYGDRNTVEELQSRGHDNFIDKPFSPGKVVDAVMAILDGKTAG